MIVVDTGPLYAAADDNDEYHEVCTAFSSPMPAAERSAAGPGTPNAFTEPPKRRWVAMTRPGAPWWVGCYLGILVNPLVTSR